MLVEMLGLPGSGKTAVAGAACDDLRGRGVAADVVDRPISAAVPRVRRIARRTSASARALAEDPRWALRSATRIASLQQPSRRDTASALAQWLAVRNLSGRARARAGVHLLEEGPRQTLWTLLLRSPDRFPPELLERLLREARCDVVVVLDVPVEVVQSRLTRRASKHSRSQQLPPALLRAELLRGRDLIELLAASTVTPVVRLTGGDQTTPALLGGLLADVLGPGRAAHGPLLPR
jgi:predicted kinase